MIRPKKHFNPRSRKGSDFCGFLGFSPTSRFQSTLPQGERLRSTRRSMILINFNPRSRKGSDAPFLPVHLPVRNFNPRSRKGSDGVVVDIIVDALKISIHAPARGATYSFQSLWPRLQRFQSTLPQGERQDCHRLIIRFPVISIHAPARGATQVGL